MNTRTWTIFISVLIVGIAIALSVWFFVKISTDEIIDSPTSEERTFLSFFGEQFGFIPADQPFATNTPPIVVPGGPTFRELLAQKKMLPIGDTIISGSTFMVTSTTTTVVTGTTTEEVVLTEEFVRFVERETGRVHDLSLETGEIKRMTNTTIPRIQEAFWGPNGSSVILRYLDDTNSTVETFVARLSTAWERSATDINGTFFPQNIISIAPSPDTTELFYITNTSDQGVGRITNVSNREQRVIFVSALREWNALWKTDNAITLTTKASHGADGVANRLSRNGTISRITSGFGLTALPNQSGTRILVSTATQDELSTTVVSQSGDALYSLPLKTLPEKCVWKNDEEVICAIPTSIPVGVPDTWYQGRVSFTDALWLINVANKETFFLYTPESTGAEQSMDIIDMHVSSDGSIISFINKKDLRGWIANVSVDQDI